MQSLFAFFLILAVVSLAVGVWEVVRRREMRLVYELQYLDGSLKAEFDRQVNGKKKKESAFSQYPRFLRWLERRAQAAGVDLRPETAMMLIAGGMVFLFIGGVVITGKLYIALLASLGGVYLPVWYLDRQQAKRADQALRQLDQFCQSIAQNMRGGASLQQALIAAAKELDPPLGPEVDRVLRIMNAGSPLEEAIESLQQRIQLPEMAAIVAAIRLNLNAGGDLPQIMDVISEQIKDIRETQSVLKAATATARMQGNILTGLPILLVFLIRSIYPEYFDPLFNTIFGQILFVLGIVWLAIGRIVMQRMFDRALTA